MDLSVDQLAYFVGIHKSTLTRALKQMTSFLTVFIRAYGGDPIDPAFSRGKNVAFSNRGAAIRYWEFPDTYRRTGTVLAECPNA
jgi:hypothetical protein